MKNLIIAAAFVAALGSAANAVQPITMDQDGIDQMLHGRMYHRPAMDELQQVADGGCTPEKCFDGNTIIRHEDPGLVILKEEFVRRTPPRHHGGREGGDYTPAKFVYKQTVGIEDREKYVAAEKTGGKVLGGIGGGALGLLGFLINPIVGGLLLVGGVVGGMKFGGDKAAASAEAQPKIFDRTYEYDEKH